MAHDSGILPVKPTFYVAFCGKFGKRFSVRLSHERASDLLFVSIQRLLGPYCEGMAAVTVSVVHTRAGSTQTARLLFPAQAADTSIADFVTSAGSVFAAHAWMERLSLFVLPAEGGGPQIVDNWGLPLSHYTSSDNMVRFMLRPDIAIDKGSAAMIVFHRSGPLTMGVKSWISGEQRRVFVSETLDDLMTDVCSSFRLGSATRANLYYIEDDMPTNERTLVTDDNYDDIVMSAAYLENGTMHLFPTGMPSGCTTSAQQTTDIVQLPVPRVPHSVSSSLLDDFRSRVVARHEIVGRLYCAFCERKGKAVGGVQCLHATHLLETHREELQHSMNILSMHDSRNGLLLCTQCEALLNRQRLARNDDGNLSACTSLLADATNKYVWSRVGKPVDMSIGKPIWECYFPTVELWKYREECFRASRVARRTARGPSAFQCSQCAMGYETKIHLNMHMKARHDAEHAKAKESEVAATLEEGPAARPRRNVASAAAGRPTPHEAPAPKRSRPN